MSLAGKRFSVHHRTFVGADIISAQQRNFTNLLFPSAKRDAFSVLLVAACPAGDRFSACPAGSTARLLMAGRLLAAMPLRDSSYPVGAVPPYGWGVTLAGKTAFSFVRKREVFTLQLVFACSDGVYLLRENHIFIYQPGWALGLADRLLPT